MEFSPELAVLKMMCKDKKLFDKYESACYNVFKSTTLLDIIFKSIKEYYSNISTHSYISLEELINYITINYSTYKELKNTVEIVNTIYKLDISDSLAKDIVIKLIEKDVCNRIINKLLPTITEGKFNVLASIEEELAEYYAYTNREEQDSPFVEDDIADIVQELVVQDGGLKWRLQCLQDSLGSLQGGILGHVFARPNSGKTSWLASEVTNFARQIQGDESIIWFNNEERGKKVKLRLFNSMLGASDDAILRDVDKARAMFAQRNGTAIRLFDRGIITFTDLRNMIRDYNPKLLVIDQADKVHFKGMSGMDLPVRLKELYKHYRELAKESDIPIITVGQASAEAEGRKWLRPDWMDYSKTGKYAEMDFILGLGKTHEEGEQALRFVNICKNKCKGIETAHTVKFDHMTARFSDL